MEGLCLDYETGETGLYRSGTFVVRLAQAAFAGIIFREIISIYPNETQSSFLSPDFWQNSPCSSSDTLFLSMKIQFWSIGKAHEPYVKPGVEEFTRRISNYYPVEWILLPVPKNAGMLSEMDLKKKEGETIVQWLEDGDFLVALDERGKMLDSRGLARFLEARANASVKRLIFCIGGAFGLDATILDRANFSWSLSGLTFPHQLVRLILAEQVYRACTILRNEKYHHS